MNKKNILYIENGVGAGGAAISLIYMLWNLNSDKYRPYVVSSYETDLWDRGSKKIDSIVVKKYSFSKSRFVRKLRKISKIKFLSIIVVLIDFLFCIIPYSLILHFKFRKKNIALIHLNNLIYENASGIILAKLLKVPCVCHERGFEWHSYVTRYLSKKIDYYIAISDVIRSDLLKLGISRDKITIVNEGIDIKEFNPKIGISLLKEKYNIEDNIKTFGVVGFLVDWKGQLNFIKMAKEVSKKIPDSKAFIVGSAPLRYKEYYDKLKALVEELNLEDYIVFTGYEGNIARFFEMLDIVIHTSIEPEPFGRVIIEGMCMEKAVIASKLGAPLEIIEDNKTGLLINPNDIEGYSNAIIDLLNNAEKRAFLGKNGRKEVLEKYTIEIHTRKIEELYNNII